jgi:endonuclease YncB( thermonuclease family)
VVRARPVAAALLADVRRLLLNAVVPLLVLLLAGCEVTTPADDATSGRTPKARHERHRASQETKPPRSHEPRRGAGRTFRVSHVVDGDTLDLADGRRVRLVGIDTPEVGECGYAEASAALARLVLGRRVTLGMSDEDHDRYGRLLRYVDVAGVDAGLQLVRRGLAVARYDSRDGYGFHPREPRYVRADRQSPAGPCAQPRGLLGRPSSSGKGRCAPGYHPCVPPYPPDVDCADLDGPVRVTGRDPHGLDADGDGVACES